MGFPSKNTGVGCHFFLQGIFPSQRSNLGLLYYRWILYQLSHQGSPTYSKLDWFPVSYPSPPLQAEKGTLPWAGSTQRSNRQRSPLSTQDPAHILRVLGGTWGAADPKSPAKNKSVWSTSKQRADMSKQWLESSISTCKWRMKSHTEIRKSRWRVWGESWHMQATFTGYDI